MKFSGTKEKLLHAALIVEKLVGKKESLPVLSCIYLSSGKELVMQATNLEAAVSVAVPGEVGAKGEVAVPASVFIQTLRSISGDKVSLSLEDGNVLIQAKGTKTLIKAVPHQEFPLMKENGSHSGVEVPREALIRGIQSVGYSASVSMIRPELGSVYIAFKDGNIVSAATDSFRLAEKTIRNIKTHSEKEVLLPLKHSNELVHVLERIEVDSVSLGVEDSQISITGEGVVFVSRVIDGSFPNYKEVVPKSFATEATMLKGDLAELLRKARVFSGQEQRVGLHVYPKKKTFTGTAQSAQVGEMSDTIEAAVSGDEIDIYFNISYISDCLQSIDSDSVVLGFAGPGRPLVMRGVSDQSFMYLVMPLNR